MSVLEKSLRTRRNFIPFIVAGDPTLGTTEKIISSLSKLRPAAIEVGVPFSDPTADGPVIQRGSHRALRAGVDLASILAMLKKTSSKRRAPIVLFGYYNPILRFGLDRFVRTAKAAAVAAVLVVDLPVEAARPLQSLLRSHQIDLIFLVAPTTSEQRLRSIARRASGFIYAVARTGVTGNSKKASDESRRLVAQIRAVSDLPIAVGFGIKSRAQAKSVCAYADAAVVGSHLVSAIENAIQKNSSRKGIVSEVLRRARQFV